MHSTNQVELFFVYAADVLIVQSMLMRLGNDANVLFRIAENRVTMVAPDVSLMVDGSSGFQETLDVIKLHHGLNKSLDPLPATQPFSL